ncbi:MAG: mannose-1-phosphate guanylyltransferase/mannose-6-phosphate isomerase [Gammaproteobacteria bacterium]|nr:mannose-1-phosphate guanylyltransferase/mannose-6-phosphate isomerase [Gammaproteobacteria bacterium]
MHLLPVILSGGSGSRLWPLSREAYPKQFLPLVGERTLLQATVARSDGLDESIELLDPLVVCNESHRFLVAEQFRQMQRATTAILLEPEGRNTAPALALAAHCAMATVSDPVMLVMPADHLVVDEAEFRRVVSTGAALAEAGSVVTFGIVPTGPETGYGYIRQGDPVPGGSGAFNLQAFVEKPDRGTAEGYLAKGGYLWNSGLFMMKASLWLKLLMNYRADIAAACDKASAGGAWDGDFFRPDKAQFAASPSDSIDYAVMEPLTAQSDGRSQAVVLPLDAGWSDVGAWSTLWSVSERDAAGNASEGDVFCCDSHDNLLIAKQRMLAVVGVSNLIVVETPDAVLVLDKEKAQDVKSVTEYLKSASRSEHVFHRKVHRPWGNYEPIDEGSRFQVKRLTVNPGGCLSLQMHHHRAEHWIVVKGTAKVTRGEETLLLSENQSTYIPLGTLHRLENPGQIPLEIIEVQSGGYLGEDDIVRFDDLYNRGSAD